MLEVVAWFVILFMPNITGIDNGVLVIIADITVLWSIVGHVSQIIFCNFLTYLLLL